MRVIGLVGPAGCGKDTVADMILPLHMECNGRNTDTAVKMAFADPLRAACKAVFALEDDDMIDRVKKEQVIERWGKSPRQMMQLLGTDCVRSNIGHDHWVKLMHYRLRDVKDGCVVISDVRFQNEADYIRSLTNSTLVRICRLTAGTPHTHTSEFDWQFIKCDSVLFNDCNLQELRGRVKKLLF